MILVTKKSSCLKARLCLKTLELLKIGSKLQPRKHKRWTKPKLQMKHGAVKIASPSHRGCSPLPPRTQNPCTGAASKGPNSPVRGRVLWIIIHSSMRFARYCNPDAEIRFTFREKNGRQSRFQMSVPRSTPGRNHHCGRRAARSAAST